MHEASHGILYQVVLQDCILNMTSGVFLIEIGKPHLKPTKDVVTERMHLN